MPPAIAMKSTRCGHIRTEAESMKINELIDSHSELTDAAGSKSAVVLIDAHPARPQPGGPTLPGWAKEAQKREIRDQCMQAVAALPQMKRGLAIPVDTLDELQKQILVERHLISRELCHAKSGSAIVISKDQTCVVMVNEEDHLRIQVLRAGFQFKKVWSTINALDSDLEEHIDYAFSPKLGYLSAVRQPRHRHPRLGHDAPAGRSSSPARCEKVRRAP